MELAQAALLRALAAKHRLGIPQLHRGPALRNEVVLHRGTHHTRRTLGAHGQALLGLEARVGAGREHAVEQRAGEDAEHLLAHHVLPRNGLHALPGTHARAKQVLGALCLVRHVASLSLAM